MSYEYPSGGVPTSPPTSSMSIISLIAGILGLTFVPVIGSIVAVITGPMARNEIRQSGGALGGEGLAMAGIILGWIGIGLGVIGLCIGITFIAIPLCGVLGIIATEATSSSLLSLFSVL